MGNKDSISQIIDPFNIPLQDNIVEPSNTGVIVIGDHVQALGIVRSLGRHKIPIFLLNDKNICIGRFSRYGRFIKTPDMNKENDFINFMNQLAERKHVKNWILMPTNDKGVYLLSKNRDALSENYKVATPNCDIVKYAYNKKLTYSIAEKNNISIPYTSYPENSEELEEIIPNIKFPVIIKPAIMHLFFEKTRAKVIMANNKDELKQAYIKASSIIDSSQIMVQEVIPGGTEFLYSFCSFFKNKKALRACIGKRSRQRPMDFGNASTFVESVYAPELIDLGTRLLKAIDYYGLSEVEFKKDPRDGKFKLLEINARTWLWHSLAIKCGVDFPYILYSDMIGNEVTSNLSFKENIKFIHIYPDLDVAIKEVFFKKMKLRDYLISLKGEKQFAVFSLHDPLPFIAETILLPFLWLTR